MIKVGLIPLDSRPCNTIWIDSLTKIANLELLMYPRSECGTLFKGANIDKIIDWLNQNAHLMDYLIISTDGLCFGGLIQARKAQIDLDKVVKQLDIIKELKNKYPKLRIFVFDTIMRIAITTLDKESQIYAPSINEYGRLKGQYHFFKKEEDKRKLEELEKYIPTHLLETYLKARKTKLFLNKYFLSLIKENIIDRMILLQEDSFPFGIQAIDQEEICNKMEEYDIVDKVQFYNGTDEGAGVLLGRIIVDEYQLTPKVYLHMPNKMKETLDKCHLFEDRPFSENLYKMFGTIGLEETKNINDASFVLALYAEEENKDLILDKYIEVPVNKDDDYKNFVKNLNEIIKQKPVLFVDLFFPNGGSLELLEDINFKELLGYSAWNTSSNSLGTALCNAVAYLVNPNSKTNQAFLKERIMDDCVYQYIARRIVSEDLVSKGHSVYNLEEANLYALEETKKIMEKYNYLIEHTPYEIKFPWGRMFEIEIKVEE